MSVKTTREPFNDGQKIAPSRASPAAAKVADEYRAKTFELMTANINSTLEYAQRLAKAKTPAEFGDLSMNQARKTFELIIKQTAELASIAQRLATFTVRRMSPVK